MPALRGSGRSRPMTRFSAPYTAIQHTRVPAGIGAQIRAARYGAIGLAAPREGPSIVTGGVARQSYAMSGPATNPATMRAMARSATARGYALRRQAQRDEERYAREEERYQRDTEIQGMVGELVGAGRIDEALRLMRQWRTLSPLLAE